MSEWAMIAFALMFAACCIEATLKRMWRRGYRRLAAEREAEVVRVRDAVERAKAAVRQAHEAADRYQPGSVTTIRRIPIDEWPETIEEKR